METLRMVASAYVWYYLSQVFSLIPHTTGWMVVVQVAFVVWWIAVGYCSKVQPSTSEV